MVLPSGYEHSLILLASSITMLHVGSGRSYGVVDLPIQRDPMGYPIILASSFKGAFKANLLAYSGINKEIVEGFLGSEPDKSPSIPSLMLFTDLVPFAIPAPSASHGLVYVTTPYLLTKIFNYIEVVKNTKLDEEKVNELSIRKLEHNVWKTLIDTLLQESIDLKNNEVIVIGKIFENMKSLEVGTTIFVIKNILDLKQELKNGKKYNKLAEIIMNLNKLYNYRHVLDHLVVVSDDIGKNVIDKTILVNYRIRINRETKTVQRGALWSEEYLPYGTLFFALVLYKNVDNLVNQLKKHSKREEFTKILEIYKNAWDKRELILDALRNYLIVGGKETIGKGMVKLDIHGITTSRGEL